MTNDRDKPNRFRPRFSVRTLAIVVTLVCLYLGLWELTGRYNTVTPEAGYDMRGSLEKLVEAAAIGPLLIYRVEINEEMRGTSRLPKQYYLWLFGPTIKLPYESTWSPVPR